MPEPDPIGPTNPFAIPGLPAADAPLNPVEHPEQEKLYVDVDNTGIAYSEFAGSIGDPRQLSQRGRLIVVTGSSSTGKSALINRCVNDLARKLRAANFQPKIVDLQYVAWSGDDGEQVQSASSRRQTVIAALATALWADQGLISAEAPNVFSSGLDPMRHLAALMDKRVVALVLLPSTDLASELMEYALSAPGKVIFFGETSVDWDQQRHRDFTRRNLAPPIHLQLGTITVDHALEFTTRRLDESQHRDSLPRVGRETLDALTKDRSMSIGELQTLFYGLYDEFRHQPPGSIGEVTIDHIGRYYIRHAPRLNMVSP
ncbi:hypothetical protein OG792_05775 [Micromonospora sp. NBC_01699]|uniref:hypothetical protein n=1 Tax=Micromonospora sp. NBC_01699 TaxID=2975984 RepID=UPI002E34AD16|nr:hypothetical protein [Micromonospora sp. NBC_01699]